MEPLAVRWIPVGKAHTMPADIVARREKVLLALDEIVDQSWQLVCRNVLLDLPRRDAMKGHWRIAAVAHVKGAGDVASQQVMRTRVPFAGPKLLRPVRALQTDRGESIF